MEKKDQCKVNLKYFMNDNNSNNNVISKSNTRKIQTISNPSNIKNEGR